MRVLLSSLLFAASAVFAAEPPAREYAVSVPGELVVNADGSVREYKLDAGLKPIVAQLVGKNVASWRFEPVLQDGQPVAARTRMTLALLAVPNANGDYELRVDDVFFGTMKSKGKIVPPRYPADAIRNGVEARVILVARVDAQGKVVDVHPYQTSLSKNLRTASMRKRFEDVSMAAVREWQYEPDEEIGGRTVGSTVMVPLLFTLAQGSTVVAAKADSQRWRSFIPGPVSPAPWVDENAVATVDGEHLGEGVASLDARFRLQSDVLGKAL